MANLSLKMAGIRECEAERCCTVQALLQTRPGYLGAWVAGYLGSQVARHPGSCFYFNNSTSLRNSFWLSYELMDEVIAPFSRVVSRQLREALALFCRMLSIFCRMGT